MRRRHALGLAALSVTGLGLGLGVANWAPGLHGRRLTPAARQMLAAVATSMLNGTRPPLTGPGMDIHLGRFELLVSALPSATRDEVSDLLGILSFSLGRWTVAGLAEPWHRASAPAVAIALQSMRTSDVAVRRQAYQALRELTIAAHFSADASWSHLGYPGPPPL